VRKAAARQRLDAQRRQESARVRYFPQDAIGGMQKSERGAISAFAQLRAQDPKKYDKTIKEAKDRHILGVDMSRGPDRSISDIAKGVNKGIHAAAEFTKKQIDTVNDSKVGNPFGSSGPYSAQGLNSGKAGKEILDLAANTPSSVYISTAAGVEAARGRPQRAKKLWKDYKATSAIPAAVSGNFKEAAKRAADHPISTGLELSGARALLGRGLGAAGRAAPSKRVRAAAAPSPRPNLKLGSHTGAPEIERLYSRDLIEKGGQVAADKLAERRARKRGHTPHAERPTKLAPALPRRLGGAEAAGHGVHRRLIRRVDTRAFSQERVAQARKAEAERQARKATSRKTLLDKRMLTRDDVRAAVARVKNTKAKNPTARTVSKYHAATAGVQLVAEAIGRVGKDVGGVRRDLRVRLNDLARVRPTLSDPERLRLNREESKHVRELGNLSDENLARVITGAEEFAKQQRPVQARGQTSGSFDEVGQSKRFYPTLQTHFRRQRGEERKGYTPEQQKIIAKSVQQRWQKGKSLPSKAAAAAANAERRFQRAQVDQRSQFPTKPLATAIHNVALREVPKRPRVGERKPVKRADFQSYAKALRARQAIPSRKLSVKDIEDFKIARTLQRRSRQGKEGLSGHLEGGPVLVTQRPGARLGSGRLQPQAPFEPMKVRGGKALEEGSREVGRGAIQRQAVSSEAEVTAAEGHQLLDREFGVPAGKGGRRYAGSRDEALSAAREKTLDPETGLLKHDATPLVPVNIAQFQTFGGRLRAKQEQGMPRSYAHINDMERQALQDTWAAALDESGRGKWVLMPEPVVQRLREHLSVGNFGPMHSISNVFKDVVLTSSSPFRWMGGNIADIGMRTAFAGLTPADMARGAMIVKRAAKQGLQGEQAAAAVAGGGMYGTAQAMSHAMRPKGMMENPGRTVLSAPWRAWKGMVYTLENSIEHLPLYGAVGKSMRRETSRFAKPDAEMQRDLKSLLKFHDAQIQHYANKLATNRAFEARIQKYTEDVMGRWGKVSPNMKRALLIAPFAQWLGAALRYTFITLPAHHPIKTSIMAGISEMTEKERKALGLSYMLPRDKQIQDYQMGSLPIKVGKNKYGPVVEGIRTARMTSLGTAAGFPGNIGEFLLPQISGPLNAWAGQSFTGEQLVYPDWWPDKNLRRLPIPLDERVKIGIGAALEASIPFASAFRRSILEKGSPAEPTSTILTPQTRKKWDAEDEKFVESKGTATGGILEWLSPFAPKSRLYTYGAGKAISEQGIAGEVLDKWRTQKKAPKRDFDFTGSNTTPAAGDGNDFNFGAGPAPKKPSQKAKRANGDWNFR
jgi:hypothetical protein